MTDHLAGAVAAVEFSGYARARDAQAVALRDEHIRAAVRDDKVTKTEAARRTGLSVAMVRVICRGQGPA